MMHWKKVTRIMQENEKETDNITGILISTFDKTKTAGSVLEKG